MNTKAPYSIKLSIIAVSIAFASLTSCASSTTTARTSTSVNPLDSVAQEVKEFVRSYVMQAVAMRPEIVSVVSQIDLVSCVTSAVGQIARSSATNIEKTAIEDDTSWYARSRSVALQSAQASIEGVISSCTQQVRD